MTATDVLYQVNLRDKFKILHDVKEFYLVCTPSRRNSAGDRAGAYFDRLRATNSPRNTNKYKFVHNHKNKKYGECIHIICFLAKAKKSFLPFLLCECGPSVMISLDHLVVTL
mgnify:CR=1 FL=1